MEQRFEIMHLGHRGDGVAAGPVFVPLSAPGDVVRGVLDGDRLRDVKIEVPSSLRVKAACPHFKSCGGCSLQHLDDGFVASWKADIVRQALAAHQLDCDVRDVLTSPDTSRRRATFAARRTKSGAMTGFHARASDTVIAVAQCRLVTPGLLAAVPMIDALAVMGASRKHGLDVTVTETEGGLDVAVSGGKPMDVALQVQLAELAEAHQLARLVWDDEVAALRSPSIVRFDGIAVRLPPGAFLQATAHGEGVLREAVVDIVSGADRIADLFSGCGTFALPLARHAEVVAYEGDKAMTAALSEGWRHATGVKTLRADTRDLYRNPVMAEDLRKIDAVVLDPPRAGAAAQIAELAQSPVERIAHVSCNPQTFARDAKHLVDAGFRLDWVQPIDQFRWSPHVELVGAFFRDGKRK